MYIIIHIAKTFENVQQTIFLLLRAFHLLVFAWDAYEQGTEVHLQADPTKLDVLAREYKKRKENSKQNAKDTILDRYGGEEHLEAPPKQLLLAQTVSLYNICYIGFTFFSN